MEKIKDLIMKNRWFLVFLCAAPFFNDGYTTFKIVQDWIMDYLKVLVFLILIVLMIVKKRKFSLLFFSLTAFEIWWFISTTLNYPFSEDVVYHKLTIDMVNALCVSLIVEYFKDDPKSLLSGLMLSLELALYPELVSVIMDVPGGNYYLLGFYSTSILWILPAICVAILHIVLNKGYIRGAIMIAVCIFIEIKIWCATMIVSLMGQIGLFVLGLALLWFKKTRNWKLPLSIFVILSIIGNVFVLFIYGGGSFPLVDAFIEKILHRSTTFTERTVIWQEAIRMIKEKPWFGHGFRPIVYATNSYGTEYIHSHNQLLQRLNATGIVGLVLFAILHVILCIRTDRDENNTIARLAGISAVFGVCITYITEAYKKFFRFYLVFFLAYHVDEMIKNKINNTDYLLK